MLLFVIIFVSNLMLSPEANGNLIFDEENKIQDDKVIIEVTSPIIVTGIQQMVDVQCRFRREAVTTMASVLSAVVSRSSDTNLPVYHFMASVNELDGQAHNITHDAWKINGSIDNNGESFLNITYRYPGVQVAGIYLCEINGFDLEGKPMTRYNTKTIVERDTNSLYSFIHSMESCLKTQQDFTNFLQTTLLSKIETRFSYLGVFMGHRYHLTVLCHSFDRTEAQSVCRTMGGYLVEVDTHDEFNFIHDLLMKNQKFSNVFTGATDIIREGFYVNEHNATQRPDVEWAPGQPPVDRSQNCQCFVKALNYFLGDCVCLYATSDDFYLSYICEIPEQNCVSVN